MNETSISQYIADTFDGVHPVDAWGDTFFYFNPDRTLPDQFYFATLVTKDNEYDSVSNLYRPGVFRLSIGVGKSTYRSLFGSQPAPSNMGDGAGYDFAALDQVLPHPVYGKAAWVCVLNPSRATFHSVVQPLLAEAYNLAVGRYNKRAARG
jgi:hypothetical protein